MSTRADRFTQLEKIPDLFSDFLNDLTSHPMTSDLVRLKNEQSIKQSLKNLILTNYGERPFQPNIGSSVYRSLFNPYDELLEDDIVNSITQTITFSEPRVQLVNVEVLESADYNTITINIVYSIINSRQLQNLDLILKRVR